ncbi:DNA alkylation repair protein [Propionibacteriaceae bacterium Y1685]|uniref:DNA alkylation repair protein n=1 Tax=Microlunatus sp. Y1700 TaxID=3418487 RepID=UPI003B79794E
MGADWRLIDEVRAVLSAAGDPERALAQQRYMKSAMPFHGVASPVATRLLRPLFAGARTCFDDRDTHEATVRLLFDEATHREQRYAAISLAGHRRARAWRDADALPLYWHLISTGAWWDLVDDIASHLVCPVVVADPVRAVPTMRAWARTDDLWVRRAAILCQLGAKAETDTALLADCVAANLPGSPYGDEFFIRKAIGWALREYARLDPAWVRDYVNRTDLAPLSRREATKHLEVRNGG